MSPRSYVIFGMILERKRNTMNSAVTLLIAILGSGGLCSLMTVVFSRRKFKAEASLIEAEVNERRGKEEREYMDYILTQLKENTETYKRESEELRERVHSLETRINMMMEWVINDDGSYRAWLENELKKYNPDIEFPECKPAPGFEENSNSDASDT